MIAQSSLALTHNKKLKFLQNIYVHICSVRAVSILWAKWAVQAEKLGLAKKLLTQQGLLTKVCNNLEDFSSMQGNINFRGTLIKCFLVFKHNL